MFVCKCNPYLAMGFLVLAQECHKNAVRHISDNSGIREASARMCFPTLANKTRQCWLVQEVEMGGTRADQDRESEQTGLRRGVGLGQLT